MQSKRPMNRPCERPTEVGHSKFSFFVLQNLDIQVYVFLRKLFFIDDFETLNKENI
jgi:hypothetical protein